MIVRALRAHDAYLTGDEYEAAKGRAESLAAAGLVEVVKGGTRKARPGTASSDDEGRVAAGAGSDSTSSGEPG